MKHIILTCTIALCGLIASAQSKECYYITRIKKIKNDCFVITAKQQNKKFTIYTHYDSKKPSGKLIKVRDTIEIKIEPFFSEKDVNVTDFYREIGIKPATEDTTDSVTITTPINYMDLSIDFHGNILKASNKMQYYTEDINGVYLIDGCAEKI